MTNLKPLPVDDVLAELVDGLLRHGSAVLRAPTGAGKTTRVPPALLRSGLAEQGVILVLQPRRVAARTTAVRMAQENGWSLGAEVGYRTRFDRRCEPQTGIQVVTEGVLLRMLGKDPFLQGVTLFPGNEDRGKQIRLYCGDALFDTGLRSARTAQQQRDTDRNQQPGFPVGGIAIA